MKKKLFFLMVTFLTTVISFAQVLDQSHAPESIGGGSFGLSEGQNVGQSFTAGITGNLSQINIRINNPSALNDAVAGDFQLKIYAGDGYSGTLLNTTTFTISTLPGNTYEELIINLSSNVSVEENSIYTMDLRGIGTAKIYTHGANPNYANGGLYVINGNNLLFNDYDYWFKTYVTLPLPATHLDFDGTDDFITLPNESNFDFTDKMTLELWINPNNASTEGGYGLIRKTGSWELSLYEKAIYYDSNSLSVQSLPEINDGNWHHIALTLNGTDAIIYIDGVESKDSSSIISKIAKPTIITSTISDSSNNVTIATSQFTEDKYSGKMDEVRIWNVARTATEISDNKDCELLGNETGLVAYYKFNQGDGDATNTSITALTDATGNNHGTFSNFSLSGTVSNFKYGSPITTGSSCGVTLNTSNIKANTNLNVYPNPANNIINIDIKNLTNATLQVLDVSGKVFLNKPINQTIHNLDISELPAGLYLFKITSDQGTTINKIIKN